METDSTEYYDYNSYDSQDDYSDDYDWDYDDYYHYVEPCAHSGNQTYWETLQYKGSMSTYNHQVGAKGTIRFSDSCIEIDCTAIQMYFGIARYEMITKHYIRIYRSQADELYDVMEIRLGFGVNKGKYVIYLAKLGDDGNLQGTVQLICQPLRINGQRQFELPKEKRCFISKVEEN